MADKADLLWIAVIGGAGFLGWRAWQNYQATLLANAAAPLAYSVPTPAAEPVPLLLPPVNLMAPATTPIATTTTPDASTTTTTPAATTSTTTAAANDDAASQNQAFADSMALAGQQQAQYFAQVKQDIDAKVQSGQLVPGTADYNNAVSYLGAQGLKIG